MMSPERYKRALDKVFPLTDGIRGNDRFYASGKAGFDFTKYESHSPEINDLIFYTRYLEFVRYNTDKIAFYIL